MQFASSERSSSCQAQEDLEALLLRLKHTTEAYLNESIIHLTVTTPDFMTPRDKSDLLSAISAASLSISSCGEIQNSAVAATITTRFQQLHPVRDVKGTPAKFILGPVGVEEVIAVDVTEDLFTLSMFRFSVGKHTWHEDEWSRQDHFIALRSSIRSELSSDDEDEQFWEHIRTGIREMVVCRTYASDLTVRLVLQGPRVYESKILSILESSLGALLPNSSKPRAIRIIQTEKEGQAKLQVLRDDLKVFICILTDQEDANRPKDYENDLLRAIYNGEERGEMIGEGFVGGRAGRL